MKINLTKIVEAMVADLGMSKKEIAVQLFPTNRHPDLALNRVMKEEGVLDADQISKLSFLSGIPIGRLFGDWDMNTTKDGLHVFTNDQYRAELDTNTWTTKIFKSGSLSHELAIHSGSITLSEFINIINIQIEKSND
jgi:hypothetical protein